MTLLRLAVFILALILYVGAIIAIVTPILDSIYKLWRMSMPIECAQLYGQPIALARCPKCDKPIEATPGSPHEPFMRGELQRTRHAFPWFWKPRPYCAVICPHCKEIVDWEMAFENSLIGSAPRQGVYRTPETEPEHQLSPWGFSQFRLNSANASAFFADPKPTGLLPAFLLELGNAVTEMVASIADALYEAIP